ncbi:sensor histidine kinase [Nafulsella turpanensis]|uniref:sensor histidine kinase n=1 Tax=Nafulsella turpanensis TaxID=1265690 RepID=UPI00034877E9|nr:PAS domain S-box protein [Nafulsella turpanensis]
MSLEVSKVSDFVLENCNDGVLMFDHELRCTLFNPAMEKMSGYRKKECLGKKAMETFPFLLKTEFEATCRKVLEGGEFSLQKQSLFFPITGRMSYFSATFTPVYDNQQQVMGGLIMIRPETEQYNLGKDLNDAEKRYINLIKNAPLPIVVFTTEEILFVNPKATQLLKAENERQILGRSPLSFVSSLNSDRVEKDLEDILANEQTDPFEHRLICLDGSETLVQATYHPFPYSGKHAVQVIFRDISEEKKNIQDILVHKEQLSEAQSMALLGSYLINSNDNKTRWSDGLLQILELPLGQNQQTLDVYLSFIQDEEEKRELLSLLQQLREGILTEAAMSHGVVLASGKRKYIKINGKPKVDEAGRVIHVVCTVQDITQQRQTEEQLHRANQILSLHLENSPLAIIQLNSELEVSHWSKRAEVIFGWEAAEVVGKKLLTLPIFPEGEEQGSQGLDQKIKQTSFSYKNNNVKLWTRKRTVVHCEVFMSGISGEDNQLNSILILLNDVTTRQLAEEARKEGQQEERKRVARDIHDGIGQMLIAIKYKLVSLEPLIEEENHFKLQYLEGMLEQALEEARSISKNLAPRSVATMGLESSLRQMCDQVKRLTAIDLKFRYIGGEQEINHKIVNALYRVAQEATQNIIKHAQASEAHLQVFQGRNFIELKVEDNGKGILEEGADGNGLKNMEERVKLLGGRFQIYSEEGKGTSLIVNIPIESTLTEKKEL